ncbi:MAG: SpoIIE family protein phosphatase [Bacteroidetes bacterium]|nr:SpoIIE family protein phosphatase [Bacteroidota bacterium]
MLVIGVAEIIRQIILAMVEKKEGSRIFAFGLLFFPACIVATIFTMGILQNLNNSNWRNSFINEMLNFMFYGSVLGISFAMTIYLARDFSKINKKLSAQLQEIKSLFNRTIEQESEKKKILEGQKSELEQQVKIRTSELEQKNRDILDNLHYARRIQSAILPETKQIFNALKDAFILYLPKDIVSGDFYTFSFRNEKVILAAADCTGHGVTGAFMSMIGSSQLNQIVNERGITQPAKILNHLNTGIVEALKQNPTEVNDGMDIALCSLDLTTKKLEYAGANRPLWLIRDSEWKEIKPDKLAIGGFRLKEDMSFTNHELQLHKGDIIYLFSDGYADQFGGEDGKKMLSKRFRDKLFSMQSMIMREQEKELLSYFNNWKGTHDQVDDVLVIGIRI